ncbi:MAG: glutamine amidotransferase [Myxococcota bacterium]
MKRLLILKTGSTLPEVAARRGDFEDWIRPALGWAPEAVEVASVHLGDALPEPSRVAGIVVTGSPAMVSEREPWSESAGRWLVTAVEAGTPVLGICYGHQLIAQAFGGRVGPNPRGREIGTVDVEFEAAAAGDALLGALGRRVGFHTSHVESVLELPPRATRLASTRLDPNHVFALGDRVWGVQFHPEFDADIMRGYLEGRRVQIEAEATDVDALLAAVHETPEATDLLRRFGDIVREPGGDRAPTS